MISKLILSMIVGVGGIGAFIPDGQASPPLRRFEYSQIHMGVGVRITLYTDSETKAEEAAKAAYARVAELEQVMSDYRPTSEISVVCQTAFREPVKVSNDLFRVLKKSIEVARLTDGAFDPTVGPLVALWRESRKTLVLPTPEAIAGAKAATGWRFVELDERARTVHFTKPGLKVDFGGIAKGDACDQALAVIGRRGIRSAMVEAGGDLKVSGPPPEKEGWTVEVQGYATPVVIKNKALSTSGSTEQFVEIGGVRYSHIVDPKTGVGLTSRIQASVIAESGLITDPWATAICVMGFEKAKPALNHTRSKVIVISRP